MKSVQVNSTGKEKNTYDAIVIGSGISGGWAAKELCELGLKTLVLERGRDVQHLKDYPTMMKKPWEFEHRGRMSNQFLKENPLISKAAGFGEDTAHFFIKDKDHPYVVAIYKFLHSDFSDGIAELRKCNDLCHHPFFEP